MYEYRYEYVAVTKVQREWKKEDFAKVKVYA